MLKIYNLKKWKNKMNRFKKIKISTTKTLIKIKLMRYFKNLVFQIKDNSKMNYNISITI